MQKNVSLFLFFSLAFFFSFLSSWDFLVRKVLILRKVGNFGGAVSMDYNALKWRRYFVSMVVSLSFLEFEANLLNRPRTPLRTARKVDGMWVLSLLRYLSF